jgi:hypothetical protein
VTELPEDVADRHARYFWQLVNKNGVPFELATRMLIAWIMAGEIGDRIPPIVPPPPGPPKEPWQE